MKEFTIKLWVKILAWLSAAIIVYLNIQLVVQQINDWINGAGSNKFWIYVIVIPVSIACLGLLFYVFIHPFLSKKMEEKTQLPHGYAAQLLENASVKYQHIGIAIDFSGKDEKIIQNAIMIGGKTASYTFIHVVESAAARYLGMNAQDYETELDKTNLAQYRQLLQKMDYKAATQIGFGNPAAEMAKIITKNDIDLLIMGAHGHKRFKDLLYGSTIDTLRHKIKIPVMVIS